MNIIVSDGLPFVEVVVSFHGKELYLQNVLLDTGSAGTIFNADIVSEIGVKPEETDETAIIRGIGGTEIVYKKSLDSIQLATTKINNCMVEIGAMDYGFEMDGIIGFDLIQKANLIIDIKELRVYN